MTLEFPVNQRNFDSEPVKLEPTEPAFRTSAFQGLKDAESRVLFNRNNSQSETKMPAPNTSIEESERLLCGAIVGGKLNGTSRSDLEEKLAALLKSPEIRAVIRASRELAQELSMTEGDALGMMLQSLQELNSTWDQILFSEGLAALNQD